jgi:very-short-patch-repair endonuclease
MLSPRTIVDAHGGIARGVQITAFGHTRRDLAEAVAAGQLIRVRPGVFATARASAGVIAAARHGGALTCAGALRALGVWVLDDDEHPHVWLGSGGRVHSHESCTCVAHFRAGRMRLGVAEVEHALVHAYGCHGAEFFFAAFESAWNKRLIGSAARSRIRRALPAGARWLVDFAHGDAQSGLESLVRLRLHVQGITVKTQVSLPGVGRVDIVIEDRLVLEADGKDNHDDDSHRHRDLQRDAAASRLGYETLRFDYAMIIHDWPTVLAAILAALARARA